MVVDAMRYDFVFETDLNNARMPFLTRLLREEKAAPFKLNAWPPTVTLPRIKVNINQHLQTYFLTISSDSLNTSFQSLWSVELFQNSLIFYGISIQLI
jgi:hypothetical protein